METTSRTDNALRTADEFDIVGHDGGLRLVGREGSLTGNRVDVMILDDLYKDAAEANSPLIRNNVWQWYCSVVQTRLHNDSREIIVFTRWHEDDLIGRLIQSEAEKWTVINFEALKTGAPTELDPRKAGEALWPQRHSAKLLEERRAIDPAMFASLYQGDPRPSEGLLYGEFLTYRTIDEPIVKRGAYIDTADTGADFLCAIAYSVGQSEAIYITDVVYSNRPMEHTEKLCVELLKNCDTQICYVESNNGGRGFARTLQRSSRCRIESFHQSANKISRILSNATQIMRSVNMPSDWRERWTQFHCDLSSFRRATTASAHDDAPDALTGVIEKENQRGTSRISSITFRDSSSRN